MLLHMLSLVNQAYCQGENTKFWEKLWYENDKTEQKVLWICIQTFSERSGGCLQLKRKERKATFTFIKIETGRNLLPWGVLTVVKTINLKTKHARHVKEFLGAVLCWRRHNNLWIRSNQDISLTYYVLLISWMLQMSQ